MNFKNDEIILTQRFAAIWAASAHSAIPVDYTGQKSEPVNGKIVRFRIAHLPASGQYAEVGGSRRRNYGTALIQIVLPTGSGAGEMMDIADAISTGFNKYRSGGLRCRPASMSSPVEEDSFIVGTVDVPYISDYSS
jgi:hypothetical protein